MASRMWSSRVSFAVISELVRTRVRSPHRATSARRLGPMNGRQPMVNVIPTTTRMQTTSKLIRRIFPVLFVTLTPRSLNAVRKLVKRF